MVNDNLFITPIPDAMPIWVKNVFLPDLQQSEMQAYKEALSNYYAASVDYLQSKNINISQDNIRRFKDNIIRHLTIDDAEVVTITNTATANVPIVEKNEEPKPKKPCACSKFDALEKKVNQAQKIGVVAIIVIVLVLIFK